MTKNNRISSGAYAIISPTRKVYIGVAKSLYVRKAKYKTLKCESQPVIYRSIKKYGWENHEFIELESFEKGATKEKLNELEIFYFWYFKSLGFSLMNVKSPGYNGDHSEETKKKMSLNSPRRGKFGGLSPVAKKVSQFSYTGKFIRDWDCAITASKTLKINHSHIIQCCKGRFFSIGGFLWAYSGELPKRLNKYK